MFRRILSIVVLCAVLVGCSSNNSTVKFDNDGVVKVNGNPLQVTLYTGNTAESEIDGVKYTAKLIEADDITLAEGNSRGVSKEDMDKYKDVLLFEEYLGSILTMYKELGDKKYIYGTVMSSEGDIEVRKQNLYNTVTSAPLTDKKLTIDIGGKFKFISPYGEQINIRKDSISIPKTIKVTFGEKPECVDVINIKAGNKEIQVKTFTDNKYSYYAYEGFTIQSVAGLNIGEYMEL